MTTREYFQRRRQIRLAWNALTRAAEVADSLQALDAVREALCWLATGDAAQTSPALAADWIAAAGPKAGLAGGDLAALEFVLRRKDAAAGHDSAAACLRDALPSLWRLLEAERGRLAHGCPPAALAVLAMRTVVSLCLIAAVAVGATYGFMLLRQAVKPNGFWVTYYADTELKKRAATRTEQVLLLDYGDRPPVYSIRSKSWSSRWESRLKIREPADYMFITKSQDGVRLYIDDRLLIDNWREQDWASSLRKASCRLGTGIHTVRVEHVVYRGQGAIQVQFIGGQANDRTDLGGDHITRPPLRECRR